MPFVRVNAQKQDVVQKLGKPSVEYGRADWPTIEKEFGTVEEKARDIDQWLREEGRLLVYSRSNSIMFVYFDKESKASHVSCFLQ